VKALGYIQPELFTVINNLSNFHLLWGLTGWLTFLVMGVSFQVIPMFHVTPNYSEQISSYLPLTLFCSILLSCAPNSTFRSFGIILAGFSVCTYAIYSFKLLSQRKRKVADMTVNFWRLALSCMIGTCVIFEAYFFGLFATEINPVIELVIGILWVYGFATSLIIGMQHKIIPFLIYMHLQRICSHDYEKIRQLPHMHTLISSKKAKRQLYIHAASLLLLLLGVFIQEVLLVASILMAGNFLHLASSIHSATGQFRRYSKKLK